MACGKVCFTKKESENALKFKLKKGRQHSREKRNYYCEECNAWHLTSMEEFEPEITEVELKFEQKWKNLIDGSRTINDRTGVP